MNNAFVLVENKWETRSERLLHWVTARCESLCFLVKANFALGWQNGLSERQNFQACQIFIGLLCYRWSSLGMWKFPSWHLAMNPSPTVALPSQTLHPGPQLDKRSGKYDKDKNWGLNWGRQRGPQFVFQGREWSPRNSWAGDGRRWQRGRIQGNTPRPCWLWRGCLAIVNNCRNDFQAWRKSCLDKGSPHFFKKLFYHLFAKMLSPSFFSCSLRGSGLPKATWKKSLCSFYVTNPHISFLKPFQVCWTNIPEQQDLEGSVEDFVRLESLARGLGFFFLPCLLHF
jgi:hypothetical protein